MLRNAFLLFAGLTVAACGRDVANDRNPIDDMTDATPKAQQPMAHVALVPTAGNSVAGTLMVTQERDGEGVVITGSISGLRPDAELAFHVHEVGDCSAPDASSAGEHFNPTAQPHGDPDSDESHLGDLPNIEANDDGIAEVDITIDDAALTGPSDRSILNRALVVHAAEDDYETQPAGASGPRIACGVIASASPAGLPASTTDSTDAGFAPATVPAEVPSTR